MEKVKKYQVAKIPSLSCKEIEAIIKCGKMNGAAQVSYGHLSIVYLDGKPTAETLKKIKIDAERVEEEANIDDELKLKEDELNTLAIQDPEEFENLLARGDLKVEGEE